MPGLLLFKIQGSGKVKEREVGTSLLRLQVTDRDVPHTPAWRAKYTVHGDGASHFKVETDDQTNDGILTVVKVRASPSFCSRDTCQFHIRRDSRCARPPVSSCQLWLLGPGHTASITQLLLQSEATINETANEVYFRFYIPKAHWLK